MQFNIAVLLIAASTLVGAAPVHNVSERSLLGSIKSGVSSVGKDIGKGVSTTVGGCALAKCAIALGPVAVPCGTAAVEEGGNPIFDAGCVSGVLNDAVNKPAACKGCPAT